MKKNTKNKIFFLILLSVIILFFSVLFEPTLLWNIKNEKEIIILNPDIKIGIRKGGIYFIDKNNHKSYQVLCRSLNDFCDLFDGKYKEHKIDKIQKVQIIYLNNFLTKNRNNNFSFASEIEYVDQDKNIQQFTISKQFIHEEIYKLNLFYWIMIILAYITVLATIFEVAKITNKIYKS